MTPILDATESLSPMREPVKLALLAAIGAGLGLLIVAELVSDSFMLHLISQYSLYDEIAGAGLGLLVGMAIYGVYAAVTRPQP